MGKQFPDILDQAGVETEKHFEHFADDTKDEEWLRVVGNHGWYVLTHDRRIRYKANEIAAVMKFGIGLFVIVGKAPFAELAHNFVDTFPKILKFIDKSSRPFIAKIYRPDKTMKKAKAQPAGYVKMWVSF